MAGNASASAWWKSVAVGGAVLVVIGIAAVTWLYRERLPWSPPVIDEGPPDPPVVREPQPPLPADIVKAWEAAGFTAGWMGESHEGCLWFLDDGVLPAFAWYRELPVSWAKLPAPEGPFGLSLVGVPLTDADLREIARFKHLRALGLYNNRGLTDAGLKNLAGFSNLQDLELSQNDFTDVGMKEVAKLKELQSLKVSHTKITDAGLRELSGLTGLRKFSMSGCESITDSGMRHLAGMSKLQSLSMQHMKISSAGLAHLAGRKNLQDLRLGATPVTDAGLKEIATSRNLRHLDLSFTQVTDAGLAELGRLTHLRELNFSGCTKLTDACVKELTGLKELKALELWNGVKAEGKKSIKAALPGCWIDGQPSLLALQRPPASSQAEQMFRDFEDRIQKAKAATIIFHGEQLTRGQNGEVARKHYSGVYRIKPEGKKGIVTLTFDPARGLETQCVSGILYRFDPEHRFYENALDHFYIGPITRSGFVASTAGFGQTGALTRVRNFRFAEAPEQPAVKVLAYDFDQSAQLKCTAQLWIEEKTLDPLRRVIRFQDKQGADVEVVEHYRGFSLEDVPEPFHENALKDWAKVGTVFVDSGRLTALKGSVDWLMIDSEYRAEDQARLLFDGAIVTLAAGSEFILKDAAIILKRGHASVDFHMRHHLGSFRLTMGDCKLEAGYSRGGRSLVSATPERVIVEQGALSYWAKYRTFLQEGVEYLLEDGKLVPQKERTLPPAERSREKVVFRLDLNDSKALEGKLLVGKLTQHEGRPVVASVKQEIKFDPGADDLFVLRPTSNFRCRFLPTGPRTIEFFLKNRTGNWESTWHLSEQTVGQWSTFTMPLDAMDSKHPHSGSRYGTVTIRGDVMIDRLEIVETEP